jgi:hypothetical protein
MKLIIILFLMAGSSTLFAQRANGVPDLTQNFDELAINVRNRFTDLNRKWKLTNEMFERDAASLLSRGNLDAALRLYYRDLETWRQIETRLGFLFDYFKSGGPGDLKNGVYRSYGGNTLVLYKGTRYTIEQLGNIYFGIALKAFDMSSVGTRCAAGLYQLHLLRLNTNSSRIRSFVSAYLKGNANGAFRGTCFDHRDDSRMIDIGFNWF